MAVIIRQLCVLSVLCGAAQALAPEGSSRRMLSFACSVVLLACVLNGAGKLDWGEYALETALYRQREQSFLARSEEIQRELDRRVIESRCNSYIWDKAGEYGLALSRVQVSVQWSLEGVWVPYSVEIEGNADEATRKRLQERLETDLGIPPERQVWSVNE